MAKNTSRYIQFYTPGTAAVKVNIQDEQHWAPLPEPKLEERIAIGVDPVAIIGFAVAVCMLVLMMLGINQLNSTRREVAALEHYVAQLTAENQTLTQNYEAGFNADEIRQKALDMGMVPVEQVPVKHIYVTMPNVPQTEETGLWDRVTTFVASVFA